MEREKLQTRQIRRPAKFRLDDEDDTLNEVGEEIDFGLIDDMEAEERRHDPLRTPR